MCYTASTKYAVRFILEVLQSFDVLINGRRIKRLFRLETRCLCLL